MTGKKPTGRSAARIHREAQERWERAKAMFEERLEYHRRRKEEEDRAARGRG